MRALITLSLLVITLSLANIFTAAYSTVGWSSLMHVVSCFLNTCIIAGIIASCELRSTWLAYVVTTGLFLLMAIIQSPPLLDVMRHVIEAIDSMQSLQSIRSESADLRLDRLSASLAISCPPMFGIAAAIVALLCFPGYRHVVFRENEYT